MTSSAAADRHEPDNRNLSAPSLPYREQEAAGQPRPTPWDDTLAQ